MCLSRKRIILTPTCPAPAKLFVEFLVTQILMIFAVRTRRSMFASRPHRAVVGLAFGTAAMTVALPFLRRMQMSAFRATTDVLRKAQIRRA